METVCGGGEATCRAQALSALLHAFNLYCALISAALICCCASKHTGEPHRWRGQNTRGMATLVVGVAWLCGAAGGCLRPPHTVQLVGALLAPLSWLAAAVLHVAIWTRSLTAPILYLAIYWLLASASSASIVYYYAMKSTMPLEVYVHGVASTLALIVSVVDFICFFDEIRKRTFPKSSPESKNESYKYNDTHFYSKITFFWLNSLLYRGYETPLEKADLGSTPENEKSKNFYNKFKYVFNSQKATKDDKKPSMWRCFARIVWPNFYVAGILKLLGDIAGIIPAVGLGAIIHYIEVGNATYDSNEDVTITEFLGNGYVVLLVITLSLVLQALLSQNTTHLVTVEGTRLKIAIQSMVYDKCMKLAAWSPDGEPSEASPLLPNHENDATSQSGLLMNLMSQDTYNIMSAVWISHYIWATPLKVTFILYFLYRKLGVSALIGTLASLILMMPIQLYIGKKMSDNSKGISKCTDHRISKISEILQGINVIKLYVWEDLFNEKILQLREVELQLLNKESVYSGFLTFTTQISTVLVAVTTFLVHSYLDSTVSLTAVNVFAALALFNHLTISFLVLPVTVVMMIQAVVSTKRIRDFLELPEAHNVPEENVDECKKKDEFRRDKFNEAFVDFSPDDNPLSEKYESLLDFQDTSSDADDIEFTLGQEYLVRLKNAAFSWRMKENFWVEIDDLDIPAGKLIMVVGSSGSGKSSLLSAILGEMYKERGDVDYNKKCTMWYSSQTPWLLERSIKDNILMDSAWCARRYTRVVRATGLRPDLQLLPDGDSTQLGCHGTPLSGGQRVRVCVARALYSRARLLVLDEPLAALDAPLARQLVARALLPAARSGRTVLLATNRLELLHYADLVIGMEDGRVTGFGKANNLSDGILSEWAKLAAEARSAAARCGAGPPGGAARERSQLVRTISRIKLEREISEDSIYVPQPLEIRDVAGVYLLSEVPCIGGSWRRPKNLSRVDFSRQISSPATTIQRSKWGRDIRRAVSADASAKPEAGLVQRILHPRSFGTLPRWTQRSLRRLLSSDSNSNDNDVGPVENGIPAEASDVTFTSITANGVETTVVPIPGDPSVPTQPVLTRSSIWCSYGRICGWYGGLFAVLAVAARALAVASDYWLARLTAENAQETLSNDKTFNMVLVYACWCAGGAAAAAGAGAAGAAAGAAARRVLHERLLRATLHAPLHRHALPAAALHRFSADVQVLDRKLPTAMNRWTQLLLLCVAALLINVITTPWSLIALLPAVFFYVALQAVYLRNARELHHLEASAASHAVSLAAQTFAGAGAVRAGRLQQRLRDSFQRHLDDTHNTLLALNSANRWLGLTMDLVGAGCVFVSLATALCSGSAGAVTGLAGAYTLLLPVYLSHLAKCRADLDLQLSAVERVVADTAVPQEDYKDDCPIPSGWQRNGRIEFEDVSVHHEPSTTSILKNINLKIEPGEKMAICGRSGSGKSTLLLTCVGGTTVQSGRVLIDGQDITRVPLRVLRHRVVVMPQENIIFSGTLRENLDPLGVHTDEEIWQSLKAVGLYDFVHAQPAGLECVVCGWRGGGCAGRVARVCGARAALHARSAAALLLDEPAAPLDAHAERSLLHALADIAPNTTVITVTHRVSSIRGYDTAAVLDEGRLAERGAVRELLATPTSRLTRMLAAVHGPG
ncbi:ATP-binding cassette sub-family C member 9-like [Aricia agestis]|uniref:ATP-binding cassette sub-family C member 9-like n=1 Tax=Aricia agestis TaxID=91739 RepID=UPI001C2056AF|nr:ATP-binding cassette sub-family C member 9-like [Aricia agestis]XP_041976837.1 ATP-binding cassette sub-family C member 9-like [Aricia agestis]